MNRIEWLQDMKPRKRSDFLVVVSFHTVDIKLMLSLGWEHCSRYVPLPIDYIDNSVRDIKKFCMKEQQTTCLLVTAERSTKLDEYYFAGQCIPETHLPFTHAFMKCADLVLSLYPTPPRNEGGVTQGENMSDELESTINTPEVEAKIEVCAQEFIRCLCCEPEKHELFYEHGQWWLRFDDPHEDQVRTFSVVDCSPNDFDFEEV